MNTQHASSVDRLLVLLVDESKEHNIPTSELLAGLVEACLLSDDEQDFHVYGIDFIRRCDKCLSGNIDHGQKH